MASEYVFCGDVQLGNLLLGQYDVLFQMLQLLTLARHLQTGHVSVEKIASAEFVGVSHITPQCSVSPTCHDKEAVAQPQALH